MVAANIAWFRQFDLRPVRGAIPARWDGGGEDSETLLWMRDALGRPIDFPMLAAMADTFYPRAWLRRAKPVPAGTVSMTTYFHAGEALHFEYSTSRGVPGAA